VTVPQNIIGDTVEGVIVRVRVVMERPPEFIIGCEEDHQTTEGLHFHLLIGYGQGAHIRTYTEIIAGAVGKHCNLKLIKNGRYDNKVADSAEYMLKQIFEDLEKSPITLEEFTAWCVEHSGRFAGDWGWVFSHYIEPRHKRNAEAAEKKKSKRNENISKSTKKYVELEGDIGGLMEWAADDVDMEALITLNLSRITEMGNILIQKKYKDMKSREIECQVIPGWKPVVFPENLAQKKIHLYLWGPANSGKTSFVEQWCKDNNLEICRYTLGVDKLPVTASRAHVILVDDMIDNSEQKSLKWPTVIGWCNGSYLMGTFKMPLECRRKIIIITSNMPPDETFKDIRYWPAFDERFTVHKTGLDTPFGVTNIWKTYTNFEEPQAKKKKPETNESNQGGSRTAFQLCSETVDLTTEGNEIILDDTVNIVDEIRNWEKEFEDELERQTNEWFIKQGKEVDKIKSQEYNCVRHMLAADLREEFAARKK